MGDNMSGILKSLAENISALVVGVIVGLSMVPFSAHAQLNEDCTISILNRTANVQPDGSWRIDNVPGGDVHKIIIFQCKGFARY